MQNRLWKACARITVAITASVVAATAGGTLTTVSPASAASSSRTPVIDVTHSGFDVILSSPGGARLAPAEGSVTAFHGFSSFQKITIESQGFDLKGRIHGRIRTYNYESLWTVYKLPKSSGWKVWALSFKKDSSQSVLKETFRDEKLIDAELDVNFTVSAAALKGVSTLRIGFETLRLQLDGTTKDFTVINKESGGAKDQDGKEIPIDFEQL
ncbi:hypothetical protein [Actinomadura litoris]|uniref:Uncharacterized protein n=1 Tax=Actinomadura litoris TaxID=2678616 RepID=A0A7K1L5B2_9ACTN|nr:hypothetical protein [Actinomadura litoris]MUN39611.1 hypothetical protein [Actinomadura litoris]